METGSTATPSLATADTGWSFDPRHNLRARAVVLCGGGALTFTWLAIWLGVAIFRQHLEAQLGPSFETLAYQVSDKLDRTLHQRTHELQFVASLASLRTSATPAADWRKALESLQDASPDFAWIGFADASGTIVAGTRGLFEETPGRDTAWFRSAREKPYAGNPQEIPELAREAHLPGGDPPRFLDLAVPVATPQGKFLGILVAHVRWSWARDVQLSVVPDTARRERLGVTVYSSAEVLLDSGGSGWTEPPPSPALPDRQRLRGFFVEHAPGGTAYFTGYVQSRGYKDFRGLNWLVTVRQPVAYALAPVQNLKNTLMRWAAVAVTLAMVLSWLFAAQLARRLRAIATAADRIRTGDVLALMPRPESPQELAQACRALGHMVEDFRQKNARLENASVPVPPRAP